MFKKLTKNLNKLRNNFTDKIANLLSNQTEITADTFVSLEETLIAADVGVMLAKNIVDDLRKKAKKEHVTTTDELFQMLSAELLQILLPLSKPMVLNCKPFVILMAGVNGSGKTTTIGKLAKRLQSDGKKVMLAAGDTFRAAAIEQLKIWGDRNQIPVIAQQSGSDSASVAFDAYSAAKARDIDVLIIDTAGRLHTQSHLMQELKKIKKVLGKVDASAPHETLLTLDAVIGQNAITQAREFNEAIGITGLVLTKLDGSAKGGTIFAIAKELNLPIRFIGVGEAIDDLEPFDAQEFIQALTTHQP